jgi:hypothetical protein
MINAAAITAFLTWFGGGGLLLERLTPWSKAFMLTGAVVIGVFGGRRSTRSSTHSRAASRSPSR